MRALLVIGALVLAACASTQLEIPNDHPANTGAASPPITTSTVLRSDFDPFASDASAPPAPAPHHHHHGGGSE